MRERVSERGVGEASVNLQFQRHVWAIYQELNI